MFSRVNVDSGYAPATFPELNRVASCARECVTDGRGERDAGGGVDCDAFWGAREPGFGV